MGEEISLMEKNSSELPMLENINSGLEIVPYVVRKAVEEDPEQVQLHDKLFYSLKRLVVQMVSTLKSKNVNQITERTTDEVVEAFPVSFIVPENCDIDPKKLDMIISQEQEQRKRRVATTPAGEILVSFKFPDDIDMSNINIDQLQMPHDKAIGYHVAETHKFSILERLNGWRVERRNRNRNNVVKYDLYYHHESSKTSFRSTNEVVNFLLYEAYPKSPKKRKTDANCSTPEGGMRRPRKKQKISTSSDPNPRNNLEGDNPIPIIIVSDSDDEENEKCLSENSQEKHSTPIDPKVMVKFPTNGIEFLAEYVLKDDEIEQKIMELKQKEKFLNENEIKLKKKEDKLNRIAATKRNYKIFTAPATSIMPQNCGGSTSTIQYCKQASANCSIYFSSVEEFLSTSLNNMQNYSCQTSGKGRATSALITIKKKGQNKKNDQAGKRGRRNLSNERKGKEKVTASADQLNSKPIPNNNIMEEKENPNLKLEAKNKGKSKLESCEANYSGVLLGVEANIFKVEQTIHNNDKNKEKATESSIGVNFAGGVEAVPGDQVAKKGEDMENSSIKGNYAGTDVVLEAQQTGPVVLENSTISNTAGASVMPYIDSVAMDQTNIVNAEAGNSNSMVADLPMKEDDEFGDLFDNILNCNIIDLPLD